MIRSVEYWPREKAEKYAFGPTQAVISITDPSRQSARISGAGVLLRLAFNDVEELSAAGNQECDGLFQMFQARQIIAMVDRIQLAQEEYELIIHCEAGLSRSAAIALFVAAKTGCDMPNRKWACYANLYVLQVLCELAGLTVDIPHQPGKE